MTPIGAGILLLILLGGVSGSVFYLVARRRSDVPGVRSFEILSGITAVWCFVQALMFLERSQSVMIALDTIVTVCSVSGAFLYLVFILEYTGREQWLTPRWMALLWAEPILYLSVYVTNPLHHRAVTGYDTASVGGLTFVTGTVTPLAAVQTLLIYVILLACLAMLAGFVLRSRNLYQKQTALMLGAGLIANVGSLLGIGILGVTLGLITIPLFISARGGIIGLALFRYDFMNVAPLASDTLVEEMADPVLVLDDDDVLVDYNQAAEETFDLGESLVGEPISGSLTEVVEAVERDQPVSVGNAGDGPGPQAVYQPNETELTDQHDIVRGALIVLRDITAQKRREEKLETLQTGSRELIGTTTVDAVTAVTTRQLTSVLEYPYAGVFLYDDRTDTFRASSLSTPAREQLQAEEPQVDRGLVRDVFEADRQRIVDGDTLDEEFEGLSPKRLLCHPLSGHGVLWMGTATATAFTEEDERFATIVALTTRSALDRAERDAQLERQREQLRDRNERLDQFASIVSHDLRNPLSTAKGFLELAREDPTPEYFEEVASSHERMERLIDDVLTLAREGEDVGDRSTVSLETIARKAWETAGSDRATLEVEHGRAIDADPERLRTAFENLFRNAREHGREDVTVTIRSSIEEGWFAIEDDGPGIPESDLDDVLDHGYTTHADGTGLGLSIVATIVRAHGWEIGVTNGPDGGARFEISGVEPADLGSRHSTTSPPES
jgi:signal transduction histidine kinase